MKNLRKKIYMILGIILLLYLGTFISIKLIPINSFETSIQDDISLKSSNSDWPYYREISLTPTTTESDYQVRVNLNPGNFDYSKVNPDGSDLRFYDQGNNDLNYWIEEWNTVGDSIIWVNIPTLGTANFFMKYGNPLATSESNGANVFMFFDEFEGVSIDSNLWTIDDDGYSSVTVSGGEVRIFCNPPGEWYQTADFGFHTMWVEHGAPYGYHDGGGGATFTPTEDIWFTGELHWVDETWAPYYEDDIFLSADTYMPTETRPVRFMAHAGYPGPGTHYGAYISSVDDTLGQPNRALRVKGWYNLDDPSDIRLDWVVVRKWSDPEPTCGIGPEQQESPFQNYDMIEDYAYSWIDASGGTELVLGDDGYAAIALPFSFTFYDTAFSTIYLGANGYLSFTDTMPYEFFNVPFPSDYPYHTYMIAPFWDDLFRPLGGNIYVQSFGTYWVAEWLNIYHINDYLVGSFEVVLYDTGEIVFNYDYLDYTSGGYTCGLNLGVDTDCYNSYQGLDDATDDFSLKFTYVPPDHDLSVSLDTPVNPEIGNSYLINATVTNTGIYDESDVDLLLYLDDIIVDSTTISNLPAGASETVNYLWNPPDYGIYNFTTYAPPVPDEIFTGNNFITEMIYIVDSKLFDGMYVNYSFSSDPEYYITNFSYSHVSGSLFNQTWSIVGIFDYTWLVDIQTRIMSGGSVFSDGGHDPVWIFTNAILGDTIPISVDGEGDHSFLVSSELIYDLPGYGLVEVWELEDLTFPGGIIWYEKSTGILLNGTFFYSDGAYNYTFDFLDTNVEFTYYEPPSLTITIPDSTSSWETGTTQSITWTSTGSISDVKIELYENDVFEMEIVASTANDGSFEWTIPSTLSDSNQYQILISDVSNPATDDFSDYFEILTPVVADTITVTTPDSLTAWEMGTSQDITWTSTGSIADVKIELYKGGVFEMEIIASTANDGSYNWGIPTDLEDGIDYQIRISDISNPAIYDDSPNFAITSVDLPGDGAIPGYNLYILIGVISIVSVILLKNRKKF